MPDKFLLCVWTQQRTAMAGNKCTPVTSLLKTSLQAPGRTSVYRAADPCFQTDENWDVALVQSLFYWYRPCPPDCLPFKPLSISGRMASATRLNLMLRKLISAEWAWALIAGGGTFPWRPVLQSHPEHTADLPEGKWRVVLTIQQLLQTKQHQQKITKTTASTQDKMKLRQATQTTHSATTNNNNKSN